MTGATPGILSVATLAALALAAVGAWLIVKRREPKRGVLMIVAAVVLLANVAIWSLPVG